MGKHRKKAVSLKPVKIHEPKCPSRTLQTRPQCDLRLLLNKRRQQHKIKTLTHSKEPEQANRNVSFQIDRKVKMSRQEVYVTVFENTCGKVSIKKDNVTKNVTSEVIQISYDKRDKLSTENQYESKNTHNEGAKSRNSNMLDTINDWGTDKNQSQKTQIGKRPFISLMDACNSLEKDSNSNDENVSGNESTSCDEDDEGQTGKRQRKRHPNRRLVHEKPCENPTFSAKTPIQKSLPQSPNIHPNDQKKKYGEPIKRRLSSVVNSVVSTATNTNVSSTTQENVWQQVLQESESWKREECWCQGRVEYEAVASEEEDDQFLDVLGRTSAALSRITEIYPNPPDPAFYIPPAQAHVLWRRLTDDMSAVECVQRVCELRCWPEPQYQTCQEAAGWTTSLQLQGRVFSSDKPAVTAQLAEQVAAQELLRWLNLRPRPCLFTRASAQHKLFKNCA